MEIKKLLEIGFDLSDFELYDIDKEAFVDKFVRPLTVKVEEEFIILTMEDGGCRMAVASMDRIPDMWWLTNLRVEKEHRRKGYGRWMVWVLKKLAKNIPIYVEPGGKELSQEERYEFYKACGFVEYEEHSLILNPQQ